MSMPAPKRRRLSEPNGDAQDGETSMVTRIHRRDDDIRSSLLVLHDSLDRYGDVIVCAHGESGTEEFACVSSLLASASRPLGAMLFGPMCAMTEPHLGDHRKQLHLRMTEPDHFRNLLRYIHGQSLPLEVDEAFQMHHVADFYEVLGLRDACCRFLLESLRPHNCCHLLSRAYDVHCEPLAQRCFDMLTLDFIAVVEHDPDFHSLNASVLQALLERDELVCAEEFELLEALVAWYNGSPTVEKLEAVSSVLLPLVRWPLVKEERREEVLKLAARFRKPRDEADEVRCRTPAPSTLQTEEDSTVCESECDDQTEMDGEICEPPLDGVAARRAVAARSRKEGLSPFESDVGLRDCVLRLFPDPETAGTPPAPPADAAAARLPAMRQYCGGKLVASHPPPAGGAPSGGSERTHELQSTKEYMVGRSRKSDIRIGHNAPMPYISSQHFRVYHSIRWPERDLEAPTVGGAVDEYRQPVLQAWLEDLSQNGTFINSTLVGKNKSQVLCPGDRIEMVFPHGRQPPINQSQNPFPTFTYHPAPPVTPMPKLNVPISELVVNFFQTKGQASDMGCSIAEAASTLAVNGLSSEQLRTLVDELVNDGQLYATIDDDHYKAVA